MSINALRFFIETSNCCYCTKLIESELIRNETSDGLHEINKGRCNLLSKDMKIIKRYNVIT